MFMQNSNTKQMAIFFDRWIKYAKKGFTTKIANNTVNKIRKLKSFRCQDVDIGFEYEHPLQFSI
jgi:hypothetical protein